MAESLLAARLIEAAAQDDVIFLARSEGRATRIAAAAQAMAPPGLDVLQLPGWDTLPYDRVPPSAAAMGRRLMAAERLVQPGRLLLVASVEAAMQRLPHADASLRLAIGKGFEEEAIATRLAELGYAVDELVDEPGEAAFRGEVLDIFDAVASTGCRIRHSEGGIAEIRRYDPATHRSLGDPLDEVLLHAAREALDGELRVPLALRPQAALLLDDGVEDARRRRLADLREAFRLAPATTLPPPDALHMDDAAWHAALQGRAVATLAEDDAPLPRFATERDPAAAALDFARGLLSRGGRVAIAGGQGRGARRFAARLAKGRDVPSAEGWPGLLRLPAGSVALLPALENGFATADVAVIPFAAIRPDSAAAADPLAPATLQPGDAAVHLDHGLGAVAGVEPVAAGDARMDCLRLDFAGGESRLVPFDELDRLWRYGASAESVALDRLDGTAWAKRRAEAEAAAKAAAQHLLALVAEKDKARAPKLVPPEAELRRFAAGFPHEPTADQAAAIAATLSDLASGRPMDRLVCGDVGFGKTEVALRAAAASVLAGMQVALVAPTTVLVRQHLETFRRRFAPLGIEVAALSRLTPPAEAKRIRAALAAGELRLVIGTTALAATSTRFAGLGLLVLDEEQRFGAREKTALARLRQGLPVLTLTATPIPRTLGAALVGLRDLSVIATPPARRLPVRTLRGEAQDDLIAEALTREARRGGQSFLVCPRIEDIAPMRDRLARLVPRLSVLVAHGGLKPAEMDEAMVRFAEGDADVLLATGIVETGLDVPRANTMLVAGADRFGLAQLHQLRGRVGRGRIRGLLWLLTEPGRSLPAATERRLKALAAMDRLGAGFVVSARDLDLRGAGDLLGDRQAGHLRLVGLELWRHLLDRALASARGDAPPEAWSPALSLGLDAFLPPEHVPEAALRVEFHARLGAILRGGAEDALDPLEEETEDRYGPAPEPLANLFALARLSLRCRRLGIAKLEAGPQAVAASFRATPPRAVAPPVLLKDGRALLRGAAPDAATRLRAAWALLERLDGAALAAA